MHSIVDVLERWNCDGALCDHFGPKQFDDARAGHCAEIENTSLWQVIRYRWNEYGAINLAVRELMDERIRFLWRQIDQVLLDHIGEGNDRTN